MVYGNVTGYALPVTFPPALGGTWKQVDELLIRMDMERGNTVPTIEDYRDAFDPGNVLTIPRLNMTRGHTTECTDPESPGFPAGMGGENCGCGWESDEPTVTLAVQGMGGSEPGEAYADSNWFYELRADGEVIMEGSDIRSGGIPKTAEYMAGVLLSTLTSYVQRCYYPGGGTDEEIREIVAEHHITEAAARLAVANYDRFSLWVNDVEDGGNDED